MKTKTVLYPRGLKTLLFNERISFGRSSISPEGHHQKHRVLARGALFLGIIFSTILIGAGSSFSLEEAAKKPAAQGVSSESESQWIWGDVVSIDPIAKKLVVKYLDYETDTDKEINIELDDKATYENVKSAGEINKMDTISVDYTVSPDGKNIAKKISVERPEGVQTGAEATTSAVANTPIDTTTNAPAAVNNAADTTVNSAIEEPKVTEAPKATEESKATPAVTQ